MSDFQHQDRDFPNKESFKLTYVLGFLMLAVLIGGGFYLYSVSDASRTAANTTSSATATAPAAGR